MEVLKPDQLSFLYAKIPPWTLTRRYLSNSILDFV